MRVRYRFKTNSETERNSFVFIVERNRFEWGRAHSEKSREKKGGSCGVWKVETQSQRI